MNDSERPKAVPEHKERKEKDLEVSTCSFSSVISWMLNFEAKGGFQATGKQPAHAPAIYMYIYILYLIKNTVQDTSTQHIYSWLMSMH